jgi:hypothetical protein
MVGALVTYIGGAPKGVGSLPKQYNGSVLSGVVTPLEGEGTQRSKARQTGYIWKCKNRRCYAWHVPCTGLLLAELTIDSFQRGI